jgi:hypothetical protein
MLPAGVFAFPLAQVGPGVVGRHPAESGRQSGLLKVRHGRFRRDMQNDGAKAGVAHPRVANAYYISCTPCFRSLAGIGI